MNTWEELREIIKKCLDDTAKSGKITAGEIDAVYKLVDVVKDLDEIIMNEEDKGYSSRMYYDDYSGRQYNDGYRDSRRSYARRRDSMGRYMDSGYSGADTIVSKMHRLMQEAETEKEREAIRKALEAI